MATTKVINDLIDLNQTGNTQALKGCVGTTAQEPTGVEGAFRTNTDLTSGNSASAMQFYKSTGDLSTSGWVTLTNVALIPDPITTNLVVSWDTTQTTGTGSTGNLLALNGTAVTSTNSSSGVDKTSSSNQDPSGNQGWGLSSSPWIESNVVMSDSTFFNTTNSNWTLEIWCKINSKAGSSAVFVNSWEDGGAPSSEENFIIGLYGASSGATTGGFHSLVRTGGGTNYINLGPASGPNYGNWSQIVFVADSVGVDVEAYVNGASIGTVALASGVPQTSNDVLTIGRRNSGGALGWNGIFRICRMYKVALTASEVLNNYDANKDTFGLS
tara:strand:+ start:604 stop:1584 length:981 start_codon:yes stop_codon:yes gene_type:complete